MSAVTLGQEAAAWLAENWKPETYTEADRVEWLQQVHAAHWLAPTWSVEMGGKGCSAEEARGIEEAFKAVGAPGGNFDRINFAGNVLNEFGHGRVRELIPGMITEAIKTCLLYSEPGAGSDLASLRTRADLEGDHYVITGQKVWTSGGAEAEYGLLLARTDWDKPKHKGISFFLIPMKQPGIEVRPIDQITGARHFNEVFLENARVPADHLLGNLNEGWAVLMRGLYYERLWMGEGGAERRAGASTAVIVDLIDMARRHGKLADPAIRQELAQAIAWRKLADLNMKRGKFAAEDEAEAAKLIALGKVSASRYLHNDARLMTMILGAETLIDGEGWPEGTDVNFRALHAFQNSIGGGTDQIQRNIIAERILGLPREMEPDRNIPFRESRAVKGG